MSELQRATDHQKFLFRELDKMVKYGGPEAVDSSLYQRLWLQAVECGAITITGELLVSEPGVAW